MFMADEIGLAKIVDRLAHYGEVRGDEFGYWKPCALISSLAAQGSRISDLKPDSI